MPFTTQAELETAIATWLDRDDLTANIPDFVTLCEAEMQRLLTTGEMEVENTSLVTSASVPRVAMPTGTMQIRRLRVLIGGWYRDVPIVSLEPSLDAGVTPGAFPVVASVVGNSLYFKPQPDGAYPLLLNYYAKFAPLTSSTTNWILDDHPDAYLYGSLKQSAPFLGTDERLSIWNAAFNSVIEQINLEDTAKRMGNIKLRADPALTYPRQFNVYSGWYGP